MQIQQLSQVESELTSLTLKQQWLQQDKEKLLKEAEERNHKVGGVRGQVSRGVVLMLPS